MFEPKYEENFLLRDLGSIVKKPDLALTELVANAYDAGASLVKIIIPTQLGQTLTIVDNGVGMTKEQFQQRWMTIRYNRTIHQGMDVEFPPEIKHKKRKAFGSNGIGRHGLLCFNNDYKIETSRDGIQHQFDVTTREKGKPLAVVNMKSSKSSTRGTKLSVVVDKNLPSPTYISQVISARFIATPDFKISVNGEILELEDHPGIVDSCIIECDSMSLSFTLIDSKQNRKDSVYSGVAIWVGGRLVGEPSWRLAGESILDSRRSFANQYLLVIDSEDLREEIAEDWSGFRPTATKIKSVAIEAKKYIDRKRQEFRGDEITLTKKGLLLAHRNEIREMPALARREISDFIDDIIQDNPDFNLDTLHLAVKAAINLEKSRSGMNLLSKLAVMSGDNVDSLDEILDQWSAHDALVVLSEIDQRLKLIETLKVFSEDKDAEELNTIHPLIFKARWLFGPEYESSEYSSNNTLQQTIQQVFGKKVDKSAFINSRKRPDIVVLKESSVQSLATESYDGDLFRIQNILLIEVKRGGFPIGREEVNQADGYVQDIAFSGLMDVVPKINAFVVGHQIKPKTAKVKEVKDSEDDKTIIGTVKAVTFSTLIDTAERRLFKLRDRLHERYEDFDKDLALYDVLEPQQLTMSNLNELPPGYQSQQI